MCGRFTLTSSGREVADHFALREPPALKPRYNIAPGQDVAVVRQPEPGAARVLEMRRWGLVPSWAKDPGVGNRLINARVETAAEKPAFRDAFRVRRCLVPASGFYEWQRLEGARRPFHIGLRDDGLFGIAGLWEEWRGPGGELVASCTVLTTDANERLRPIHDRMPVILSPSDYPLWLDPSVADPARLLRLARPFPAERLELHPVSSRVNRPDFDDPACIEPADDPVQRPLPL